MLRAGMYLAAAGFLSSSLDTARAGMPACSEAAVFALAPRGEGGHDGVSGVVLVRSTAGYNAGRCSRLKTEGSDLLLL